jgi:hypothetical protein
MAATIAVYLTAFFLPAWHDSSRGGGFGGPSFWGVPISGARAFVMSVFVVGLPMWLANPAYWLGLFGLGLGSPRTARISAIVAVLLAMSELPIYWGEVLVGYWVWSASMGVLLASSFWESREDARQPCDSCIYLAGAGLVVLVFIIGFLLLMWPSEFSFEDFHHANGR